MVPFTSVTYGANVSALFIRRTAYTNRRKSPIDFAPMEDYTAKYIGEHVELWLFGGESQSGQLTAFCAVGGVPNIELNGHILIPLQNVSGLHCTTRCDSVESDWPPMGAAELDDLDS